MRVSLFISLALATFLAGFFVLFLIAEDCPFVDLESFAYLFLLTALVAALLRFERGVGLPLVVIAAYYVFVKYYLGSLNLFLLSQIGRDTWMYEGHSWATAHEVNTGLRHAFFCMMAIGVGISIGTRLFGSRGNKWWPRFVDRYHVRVSSGAFLIVFLVFALVQISILLRIGYGSMSGIEHTGRENFYNLISAWDVTHMSLALLVFQGREMKLRARAILTFILIMYVTLIVLSGQRSSIYYLTTYTFFLVVILKGDIVVRKKFVTVVLVLIVAAFLLYPVGKAFKHLFLAWSRVETADVLSSLSGVGAFFDPTLRDFRFAVLEITDRISDVSGPLHVINDTQVMPLEEHVNITNVFKRSVNNLMPGELFTGILPTSGVYEYVYKGQVFAYGGEEWGLFGTYYALFGYVGSLLGLFMTFVLASAIYKKIILTKLQLKPIVVLYVMVFVERFFHNALLEYWIATVVGTYLIRAAITLFAVGGVSILVEVGRQVLRARPKSRQEHHDTIGVGEARS